MGSICVSGTVRDQIGDRLPDAFEDMGEQIVQQQIYTVLKRNARHVAGSNSGSISSNRRQTT